MTLIFGGAYQGKAEYAQEYFQKHAGGEVNCHHCNDTDLTLPPAPVYLNLENWILALVKAKQDILPTVEAFCSHNPHAIITFTDIFCGVVPIDKTQRHWREQSGRAMGILARKSTKVVRMFCGIATTIKG